MAKAKIKPAPSQPASADWDGAAESQDAADTAQAAQETAADTSAPAPEVKLDAPAAQEEFTGDKFPDGLMESFKLLKEVEAIPAKSKSAGILKENFVNRLKAHIHDLQQGLPLVKMGANELAKEPGLNNADIQAQRIELRARGDRDIAEMLGEIRRLEEKLEQKTKE